MEPEVRPARPEDPGAGLLYLSAAPYYDAYAGSGARARALLEALFPLEGHTASWDVCRVATLDGEVAGVLAAFPTEAGDARARRFVRLTLLRTAPWRIPHLYRHLRATATVSPVPPPGTLYVDALAVDPRHRRRGVASALLHEADRMAAERHLSAVALDTGLDNTGARALYEASGFAPRGLRPVPDARTARAIGGSGFVSYLKPAVR